MISYCLLGYLLGFTGMVGMYARSVRMREEETYANAGIHVAEADTHLTDWRG